MKHITDKLISGDCWIVGYSELDIARMNVFDDSEVVYMIELALNFVYLLSRLWMLTADKCAIGQDVRDRHVVSLFVR